LALRAQDVESGLQSGPDLPPFATREFKKTFLAGKAARLAAHIGGADVFEEKDIPRLEAVADSLGVEPLLLPVVLGVLEEIGFVDVAKKGGEVVRVRENVPRYGDLYEGVGQHLASQAPSEVELATLESFHHLTEAPRIDDGGLPIQQLSLKFSAPILEATDNAGLIRLVQVPNGEKLAFSPQYWDENVEATHRLLQEFGDERFRAVHKRVQEEPGFSLDGKGFEHIELAKRLAAEGVLPSPDVEGLKGKRQFAFVPYRGFAGDPAVQSKLVEKVRALIACVRYGQHYGTGSKILYPGAILRAFRDKGSLRPHSDPFTQYRMLYDMGMVRLEKASPTSDRYVTTFIDTEENSQALEAAISLLAHGSPVEAVSVNQELRNYAINASYQEPVISRAKRTGTFTRETQKVIYEAMRDIITL